MDSFLYLLQLPFRHDDSLFVMDGPGPGFPLAFAQHPQHHADLPGIVHGNPLPDPISRITEPFIQPPEGIPELRRLLQVCRFPPVPGPHPPHQLQQWQQVAVAVVPAQHFQGLPGKGEYGLPNPSPALQRQPYAQHGRLGRYQGLHALPPMVGLRVHADSLPEFPGFLLPAPDHPRRGLQEHCLQLRRGQPQILHPPLPALRNRTVHRPPGHVGQPGGICLLPVPPPVQERQERLCLT